MTDFRKEAEDFASQFVDGKVGRKVFADLLQRCLRSAYERGVEAALTAENAVMYSALLAMHRISFDDERTEHQVTAALNAASAALNTPNPAAMRMVEVVNAARAFVEAPDGSHQAAALYEILEDALAALTKGEEG